VPSWFDQGSKRVSFRPINTAIQYTTVITQALHQVHMYGNFGLMTSLR
jgi:hypothetical protein